jgi:hypothetical protein
MEIAWPLRKLRDRSTAHTCPAGRAGKRTVALAGGADGAADKAVSVSIIFRIGPAATPLISEARTTLARTSTVPSQTMVVTGRVKAAIRRATQSASFAQAPDRGEQQLQAAEPGGLRGQPVPGRDAVGLGVGHGRLERGRHDRPPHGDREQHAQADGAADHRVFGDHHARVAGEEADRDAADVDHQHQGGQRVDLAFR